MLKNESVQTEGLRFISNEQIEQIQELKDLCFFPTVKERKAFLLNVSEAAGCKLLSEIPAEQFEVALSKAKSILHKIGESVFRPQKMKRSARIESDDFNSFDI